MIVAYLLFASGQELLLQSPVTLCLLRQKFCFSVLALKLQWTWPMTCEHIAFNADERKSVNDGAPGCPVRQKEHEGNELGGEDAAAVELATPTDHASPAR